MSADVAVKSSPDGLARQAAGALIADCRETLDISPLTDEQADIVERISMDHLAAAIRAALDEAAKVARGKEREYEGDIAAEQMQFAARDIATAIEALK